jgi:hypothetical protein
MDSQELKAPTRGEGLAATRVFGAERGHACAKRVGEGCFHFVTINKCKDSRSYT